MNVFFGNHALTGQKIAVPLEDLACHWYVPGKTGRGKSKFLEIFCRAVIDAPRCLVVVDGKGGEDNLFDAVLAYCVEQHWEERVKIIDPTSGWATGLNYLEPIGEKMTPAAHAARVYDGFARIFEEQGELKPLLEKWLPATARPLIEAKLTVAEMEIFASFSEPKLREATLKRFGEVLVRQAHRWGELMKTTMRRPEERGIQLMAVQNRGALIIDSDEGEAMFGQLKTSIDWRQAMDTGQIILVRCHQGGPVSHRLAQAIGVTVVHQIIEAGESRPAADRPDVFVVCDEFQEFACDDFVHGLSQMRSFHVWFVLAHQFFTQLRKKDEEDKLLAGIKSCADGQVVFALSYEDAVEIARELYQDRIHGDEVKHWTEKYRPVETTRQIHGTTKAHAEGDADSFMDVAADGSMWSSGSGAVDTFGLPGLIGPGPQIGSAMTHQDSSGSSRSHAHGAGGSHSSADITGESVVEVPWYEYHKYLEPSQWFTPGEQLERFARWIMEQNLRRASFKLGTRKTIPIVTAYVEPPVVTPEEVAEFKARVLARCARPVKEVLPEIRARVAAIVDAYEEEERRTAEAEEAAQAAPLPTAALAGEQPRLAGPPPEPIIDPDASTPKPKRRRVR